MSVLRNPTQQGRMDGLYELGQPLKSERKKAVVSFLKLKQAIINKGKKTQNTKNAAGLQPQGTECCQQPHKFPSGASR